MSSTSPADAPPTIEINGANPAIIYAGDGYAALGATITGATDADKNLGLKYFFNGQLVSDIVLDTSHVATDTIDYVATDQIGLTATSTRTVIVEPARPVTRKRRRWSRPQRRKQLPPRPSIRRPQARPSNNATGPSFEAD
jgi:hypothetical protein